VQEGHTGQSSPQEGSEGTCPTISGSLQPPRKRRNLKVEKMQTGTSTETRYQCKGEARSTCPTTKLMEMNQIIGAWTMQIVGVCMVRMVLAWTLRVRPSSELEGRAHSTQRSEEAAAETDEGGDSGSISEPAAGAASHPARPRTELRLFWAFSGKAYFNFCCWANGQLQVEGIKSLLSNCQQSHCSFIHPSLHHTRPQMQSLLIVH
jgi:hypothetical protein